MSCACLSFQSCYLLNTLQSLSTPNMTSCPEGRTSILFCCHVNPTAAHLYEDLKQIMSKATLQVILLFHFQDSPERSGGIASRYHFKSCSDSSCNFPKDVPGPRHSAEVRASPERLLWDYALVFALRC